MDKFAGFGLLLRGEKTTSRNDEIIPADGTELPLALDVTVHKAENLYRPTIVASVKFDPYIACYLTPHKNHKQMTPVKAFSSSNPVYEHTMSFGYRGEPLLVVQAWDADRLRHEFIGEAPVNLLSIINTQSRTWTGPITIWGQKGTAIRGKIWVTLQFRGGSAFSSMFPSAHRSQTEMFNDSIQSENHKSSPRESRTRIWCC